MAIYLGRFMAQSFYPAKVVVPKNTLLTTKLFKFESHTQSIYYDNHVNDIYTPTTYLNFMIKNNSIGTTINNLDNHSIYFNTNGQIEMRHLQMLQDMRSYIYIDKCSDEDYIKFENKYIKLFRNFNDEQLFKFYNNAKNMINNENVTIKVNKSPCYNDKDLNGVLNKSNLIKMQLKERYWCTGDVSSPATQIFLKKSQSYNCINKIGYMMGILGIDFSYCKNLPWYELSQNMNNHKIHQENYDIGTNNTYTNKFSKINIIEMLIFSEILKKEGAEFNMNY
jgi:hypothetical protein